MSSETVVRRVKKIHLGNGKYLDERAIEMQWFAQDEDEDMLLDDEMETLALLSFDVESDEYAELSRLGMVDSVPGGDDEDRSCRVTFRTDRDLLDEVLETFEEEWDESYESASEEPTIWNDLDYWELHSVD